MLKTLQEILEKSAERLYVQSTTFLPSVLAAVVILAVSYVIARACQWAVARVYHAVALDRFLQPFPYLLNCIFSFAYVFEVIVKSEDLDIPFILLQVIAEKTALGQRLYRL